MTKTTDTIFLAQAEVRSFENVRKKLDAIVQSWDKTLAEWIIKLQSSPSYALEWSRQIFEGAAKRDLAVNVIEHFMDVQAKEGEPAITPIVRLTRLQAWLTDELMRKAKNSPPSSSSQTSNLMDQYRMTALGSLLDDIKWPLQYYFDTISDTSGYLVSDTTREHIIRAVDEVEKTLKKAKEQREFARLRNLILGATHQALVSGWIEKFGRGTNIMFVIRTMFNERMEAKKAA